MKINTTKEDKISETLKEAQKSCSARIVYIEDVLDAIKEAEKHLERFKISKKSWQGCRIEIDTHCKYSTKSGQKRSSGTVVALERGSNSWFMVACVRFEAWQYDGKTQIVLSESALESMKKNNRVLPL